MGQRMTIAAQQYIGMALDYLEDAMASVKPEWLMDTPEGKILRKARRLVRRLHEGEATATLDEEGDEG